MKHILITDIQNRKTFDIVSILKYSFKNEHFIFAGEGGKLFCKLCYGKADFVTLRTEKGKDSFDADFGALLDKYRREELIYIPVEENTTDLFVDYVETHQLPCKLTYLLPPANIYKTFRNKKNLNKYCLTNGFSAPMMYAIDKIQDTDYPVILKPIIGSGSHGIIRLYNPNDLTAEILHAIEKEKYVVQELIPNGKEVKGAFFLYVDGNLKGAYTHQRIRTSPETGGVTVLSRMQYDYDLIQQGSELLSSVKWNGLIMLEYLWDERTQTYKVIEANPRLWGSIMLSEYGGAYLLTNYVRFCLGLQLKEANINTDRYIRWIFPIDILNLFKHKFRIKGFWNFRNQCFINWSYARKDRALCFLCFSIFNVQNIKKFFIR